ncbi:MAG: monofunctional biosynthetic peptidoglycan transglycosylase, partial [Elusimicrobiota bacterium]
MRKITISALILTVTTIVSAAIYVFALPDVTALKRQNPTETAFMRRDIKRSLQIRKRPKKFHIWVPLRDISPWLRYAVI